MAASLPVFVLSNSNIPADRTVAWESVYKVKKKVFICYRPHREISNHGVAPRERKFLVFWNTHCNQISSHYTLEAAEKAATRYAKQYA